MRVREGTMTRSLFLRSLRHQGMLLVATWFGLVLFELALIWVAARIDTGLGLRGLVEMLVPPDIREVIFSQLGLASFSGAVTFGFQHPLALAIALAFLIAAATAPAGERETGFLDLILAHPVTRRSYLMTTCLYVGLGTVLLPLALLGGAVLGLALVDGPGEMPWTTYIPSALMLWALFLAVAGYTILFTVDAPRRGVAVARAAGMTLLFFWLDFMGSYWDLLDVARWITPFAFFDPVEASTGGLPAGDLAVLLTIAFVCLAAAFLVFQREDL
jgi:ABC-2 type transport system permease protein